MLTPLVIVGAGGFAREALDVIEAINREKPTYEFLGFLVDGPTEDDALSRRNARVLGGTDRLPDVEGEYLIGIGDGAARARFDRVASAARLTAAIAVHPSATLGADVRLGPGAVICAGARLTTNISLGRHGHVNLNATIGHDCVIGDYVTMSPGAHISGRVIIGDGVTIGTGAAVIERLTIGRNSVVGAGAVVVRDVPPDVTAVGIPARALSRDVVG